MLSFSNWPRALWHRDLGSWTLGVHHRVCCVPGGVVGVQLTSRFTVTGCDSTGSSPASYRWWSRSRTRRRSAWACPRWPLGTGGGSENLLCSNTLRASGPCLACDSTHIPNGPEQQGMGPPWTGSKPGLGDCALPMGGSTAVCPRQRASAYNPSAAPRDWQDVVARGSSWRGGQCGQSWAGPPCPAE